MPKTNKKYYSNGKLLLTAEYFVLKGAKALALPVRYGQKMKVKEGKKPGEIHWKAFALGELWFYCKLKTDDFQVLETSDMGKAKALSIIFQSIEKMDPSVDLSVSWNFRHDLNFKPDWGLGSSSTLIANLAAWAQVDSFELNQRCFNGSGFDIACANARGPIIYQQHFPSEEIELDYPFSNSLFFVYSGKKKNTRGDVITFNREKLVSDDEVLQMNLLTGLFAECKHFEQFKQLIKDHEQLVSVKLGIEPIKKRLFNDFKGEIKSLGAWGGDFLLVAADENEAQVNQYFSDKGYSVIFKWDELLLSRKKKSG